MIRSIRVVLVLFVITLLPGISSAQGGNGPTCTPCSIVDSVAARKAALKVAADKRAATARLAAQRAKLIIREQSAVPKAAPAPTVVDVRVVAPVKMEVSGSVMLTSPTVGFQPPSPSPSPAPVIIQRSWFDENKGWVIPTGVAVVACAIWCRVSVHASASAMAGVH